MSAHTLEGTYVASVLARPSLYQAHRVAPEAISHAPYRLALNGIMRLVSDGQRVSPRSLSLALGKSAPADLIEHLVELPVEMDLEPVAAHLRTASQAREILDGVATLKRQAESCDLAGCRETLGRLMLVQDTGDVKQSVLGMQALLRATVNALNDEGANQSKRISLGMDAMDASYKLSPGSMLVVGAYTNIGKSSLITTWMLSIARRGIPCGVISVEDPEEDFGAKVLGSLANINTARMWSGAMSSPEWARVYAHAEAHAGIPFFFGYAASRGIDDVLARVEMMVRVHGVRVIAVDYLQAIAHRRGKDIRERIDGTLEDLIALCGRLGVALILASQMSRPPKGDAFKEPSINDLKESGSIEARAQCVVLLWRESDKTSIVKAKIAKAKRQPVGARFTLDRDPDTGMLIAIPDEPERGY